MILHVLKTRLKTKGDRAVSVAAPRLWNPLPMHIKPSPSVDSFKSRFKSYLLEELSKCIRAIRFEFLMFHFVCVTVCNDAGNGSCFKCDIEITFVLYCMA